MTLSSSFASVAPKGSSTVNHIKRKSTKPKPFSLRLSPKERLLLNEMAGAKPLGSFIRSRLFGELSSPRKLHQRRSSLDHRALAQALALLGQSRIASNLNQLAKAANIGALPVDDEVEAELREACQAIAVMRYELVAALGLEP